MLTRPRLPDAFWLLVPCALVVYVAFEAGGFFAGTTGVAAAAAAVALAVRLVTAQEPLAGLGTTGLVAVAAFALLAVWTLLSGTWSDAPARALLSFDRVLLYALVVAFFATMPRRSWRLRGTMYALLAAIVVVCAVGLVSRVAPDVLDIGVQGNDDRLGYPLTYWNALGIFAVTGLLIAVHAASGREEPTWARIAGAAVAPLLAVVLLLTFSRGALVAGAVGLAAYVLLAADWRAVLGLVAAGAPAAVAVATAYGAERLATEDYALPAGVAEGHRVALVVLACTVAAAGLRAALLPADRALARIRLGGVQRMLIVLMVVVAAAGVFAVVSGSADAETGAGARATAPAAAATPVLPAAGPTRERLTGHGLEGRPEVWGAAIDMFEAHPLTGTGAGTFQVEWLQRRTSAIAATHAHSVYLMALGELGIPGALALVAGLGALLFGVARRIRGRNRAVYAAIAAVLLAWGVHAALDWDWEMPAVTIGPLALAAAATARGTRRTSVRPARTFRLGGAVAVLLLAVTPGLVAVSQARLDTAVDAFARGDCRTAIDSALASSSTLSLRPEPYEILGYCDARAGNRRLAVDAVQSAIARDPGNWEFRYALAIVDGAFGRDPRPALRDALRLNPQERLLVFARDSFAADPRPRAWRRIAARLPLDVTA